MFQGFVQFNVKFSYFIPSNRNAIIVQETEILPLSPFEKSPCLLKYLSRTIGKMGFPLSFLPFPESEFGQQCTYTEQ